MKGTRRITRLAMLLVLALAASYAERLVPSPLPMLPGIKLGLANAVVLVVLYTHNTRTALVLSVLRVTLAGLLFTGVWGMLYALSGAVLSFAVMAGLKQMRLFGVIGVSAAGGAVHNFGQLVFAALVMRTSGLFAYLPLLIIAGTLAGVLVGVVAGLCVLRLNGAMQQKGMD